MTTSMIFTIFAAATHVVVLLEVGRFFTSSGVCRESDKHLVATSAVGSVAFIIIQALQVTGWPTWYADSNPMAGLWSGFAIFNAALYYAMAKILADRRRSKQGLDATDRYRMNAKAHGQGKGAPHVSN